VVHPADGLQQVLGAADRYRDIFNAAADAMALRDEEFRVVDVNPAFVAQTGFSREEALGKDYVLGGAAEPQATIRARHRRVLAGEPAVVETRRVRKDGTSIDVELRCIPIQHQGRPHVLYVARDISARKRTEEALRRSEEQYRTIFNAAQDSMVLRDAEFRMVDVNAAWSAVTGYAREEAIGLDRLLGDDPPEFERLLREQHRKALAGERSAFDTKRTRRDGRRIDLEIHALPVEHRGRPHVLFIGRDITERKRAEEALRVSEEQHRAIFNASADSMILRDADFRVVDVNPAFERLTGYAREECIGKDRVIANLPEMNQTLKQLHARALDGEPIVVETQSIGRDGSRFEIELRGVPMQYRGSPHVLYIGRDISERKRAEAALRSSEEQYRAIFAASVDGMSLRDAQFRVVDVNPAYERMSGYARAEVLGKDCVVASPRELEEMIRDMHRRALAGELAVVETQAQKRDGSRFEIELHAVPMHYRGEPHVLFIGRDITARKRAEEALRVSEEQYRSIFNASQDTMVLRDADFRIVDVNAAWAAVTGFTREEALGQEHVLGNDPPAFEQLLRYLHHRVLGGETIVQESERIRSNGRREWRELRAVRVLHQGKPHVL
jgi:PAS domain S-box-containing protein